MLLQALLQGFALADQQANGFQLMIALLETQDLAVSEHSAIVADDPKLKVNVHGRRHAGVFRKLQGIQPPNYPPSPTQATNLPRFLLLSFPRTPCVSPTNCRPTSREICQPPSSSTVFCTLQRLTARMPHDWAAEDFHHRADMIRAGTLRQAPSSGRWVAMSNSKQESRKRTKQDTQTDSFKRANSTGPASSENLPRKSNRCVWNMGRGGPCPSRLSYPPIRYRIAQRWA